MRSRNAIPFSVLFAPTLAISELNQDMRLSYYRWSICPHIDIFCFKVSLHKTRLRILFLPWRVFHRETILPHKTQDKG